MVNKLRYRILRYPPMPADLKSIYRPIPDQFEHFIPSDF